MKKILVLFGLLLVITNIDAASLIGIGDYRTPIYIQTVKASSFLIEKDKDKDTYEPWSAYDLKYETAWVEGVDGPGIGEWIQVFFGDWWGEAETSKYVWVYRISVINGFAANKNIYYANNRVKKAELEFSTGEKVEISFKDGILDYQRFMLTDKGIRAKWVKLKILDVYKGSKYNDTCISEILVEETRSLVEIGDKVK